MEKDEVAGLGGQIEEAWHLSKYGGKVEKLKEWLPVDEITHDNIEYGAGEWIAGIAMALEKKERERRKTPTRRKLKQK